MSPARASEAGQGGAAAALLGVETSLKGCRWEAAGGESRLALALAQRYDLPEIVGRVLAARGVSLEAAPAFLEPRLRDHLPDPATLKDMERATARLADAVVAGERITIFGDYDVDGATSAALLAQFLGALGQPPRLYIPDRLREGYGPNAPALESLAARGARLVVTVDCGTLAFAALEAAAAAGLEVIVVDHHAAEPELPRAFAVINPNRQDEAGGLGHLAAVGVTFLLVVALNRALRLRGWYGGGRREPDLMAWLDLVALGTVCDVVPLTGLNRAFVAQGLKVLAARGNPGLRALADTAGLKERPDAYHAGFLLGPRINAGGRVGEADLGVRLLTTGDEAEAAALARRLDGYNRERREIEAAVLEQAIAQVEARIEAEGAAPQSLVLAANEGWHPGVIGIVASRLKERYNLPALVIDLEGRGAEDLGKGSGRSVPGVDLGNAVIAAHQAGLLLSGGGHPMAAGVSLRAGDLPALRAFLSARIGARLAEIGYRPSLRFDGLIQPRGADSALIEALEALAPFGAGNPEPRFALPEVRVAHADRVGENHVRCRLEGRDGGRLKGIAFRAAGEPLGRALLESGGRPLHLAGKLRLDAWAGAGAVQFLIEDAAALAG